MRPRSLILTGASGFVGRHVIESARGDCVLYGLSRRSQSRAGVPEHSNVRWLHADITDWESVRAAFRRIVAHGPVDAVVHLAAYYDFTGEQDPLYWRTNVEGMRHVLEATKESGIRNFVFSSSLAVSRFPDPGKVLDETSPPDGVEIYSVTKAAGERMLGEYDGAIKSSIVRFAALFSDWCEYPPLFALMETWTGRNWNRRLVAGRGRTGLPYLHVREIPPMLRRVFDRFEVLAPRGVVIASGDGATSQDALFEAVALHGRRHGGEPIHIPKALCGPGMWVRDLAGRLGGHRPFERPWMAKYIDRVMAVNAARTRSLLGWAPRERLEILRRMPFLIENLEMDPIEWHRRNHWAMRRLRVGPNLRIYAMLEKREKQIVSRLTDLMYGPRAGERFPTYQRLVHDPPQWQHGQALHALMNAIRTRERGIFFAFCEELADRRFAAGFPAAEVCDAVETVGRIAAEEILEEPEAADLREEIEDYVTMPLKFGIDHILDRYDVLAEQRRAGGETVTPVGTP
ncbi:MAG TPA: NAD(P)-dependent oxidoreductase [Candidatus Polarisedimenticolaceae bacterium]